MNKNFSTLKTNVCEEVMDTSAPMLSKAGRYINKRYFQILRQINWNSTCPDYTFSTVAGTSTYTMPDDFGKEEYVFDTTNNLPLERIEQSDLARKYSSSINSQGNPRRYFILVDCVKTQPTSASVVTVVSSYAGDNSQKVFVRGIDNNGREVYESLNLSGTTPVSSSAQFTRYKVVAKSDVTVGTVTVTHNGTTVSQIAPSNLESKYTLMRLHEIPSSIITISAPFLIKPLPMVSDYDVPILDIADLIETGAKADALRYKKQYSKAQTMDVLFEKELQEFIWDLNNNPNEVITFSPKVYPRELL